MLQWFAAALYWSSTAMAVVWLGVVIFPPERILNKDQSYEQHVPIMQFSMVVGFLWIACFVLHWMVTGRFPWPAKFINKDNT